MNNHLVANSVLLFRIYGLISRKRISEITSRSRKKKKKKGTKMFIKRSRIQLVFPNQFPLLVVYRSMVAFYSRGSSASSDSTMNFSASRAATHPDPKGI